MTKRVKVPEASVASVVEDALDVGRWRWTHFRAARTADGWRTALAGSKGFPDYFALRGDRAIVIECKSDTGKTTDDQEIWLMAFRVAGIEAHVVGPEGLDWIIRRLK